MPTPVPTEPRRFSLKDDTTFSGIRIHPSDREVDGGGYIMQGPRPWLRPSTRRGQHARPRSGAVRCEPQRRRTGGDAGDGAEGGTGWVKYGATSPPRSS